MSDIDFSSGLRWCLECSEHAGDVDDLCHSCRTNYDALEALHSRARLLETEVEHLTARVETAELTARDAVERVEGLHADNDALRARALTELAYQRGVAEGAIERGAVVEREKAAWQERALAAEAGARAQPEAIALVAQNIERITIERVAAWLDGVVTGPSNLGATERYVVGALAKRLRSGAWKEK